MVVHTEVDKVEDGAITAVTLTVMDAETAIHRCSFDIVDCGTTAKAKSCEFGHGLDEEAYENAICLILNHLKQHGIERAEVAVLNKTDAQRGDYI